MRNADDASGPETVDRALIGAGCRLNERASTLEFTRIPSNGVKDPPKDHNPKESIIYRIHPSRESSRLIFQLGTASPDLAVQAAHLVAPHIAGIDVNAGCPKPFSTSGGMGAALLSTPELLCSILRALVKEVGAKYEIGISVKIRLLSTEQETRVLVEQLCQTGITGLTIHCRTRSMRKTERAVRHQLKMIGEICKAAGVACLMNGDVQSREEAEQLAADFGVDGAMIATAAEKNLSVFRPSSEGGAAPWRELVSEYMQAAIDVENRWGNTKFLLAQLMPGKEQAKRGLGQSKNYEHICDILDLQHMAQQARDLDGLLDLTNRETKSEQKAKSKNNQKTVRQASPQDIRGGDGQRKKQKMSHAVHIFENEQRADFLTDLHHDIVAPSLKV